MSTPVRVAAFVAGLAAVFAAAFGLGTAVDPDTEPVAEHGGSRHGGGQQDGHDMGTTHGAHEQEAADVHLAPARRSYDPGDVDLSFQVRDADGMPVTSYDVEHEKQLHVIVLDTRDLTDYQHVHPTMAADGTWTARVQLAPGTSYRLYADGSTHGTGFLATAEAFTTGHHPASRGLPAPATRDRVDGFDVELGGHGGTATLSVTRAGQQVRLEPYLGALGHLVAIRVDDLAYLHVHPEDRPTPTFSVAGLAPGRYRYFFDFQVDGVVRTASFTVDVGTPHTSGMPMGSEEHDHD
jgi:hypothetical protein